MSDDLKDELIKTLLTAVETITMQRNSLYSVVQAIPDWYDKYEQATGSPLVIQHTHEQVEAFHRVAEKLFAGASDQEVLGTLRQAIVKIQQPKN